MRNRLAMLFALPLAAAAPAAVAQPPLAATLAGKTCQGTFDTGRKQPTSKGALELRFALQGGRLTAQVSRAFGQAAHDQAAYALTGGQTIDASGFEQLGPAGNLTIAGRTIRYVDPSGAVVALSYKRGALDGSSDPRGAHDPRMTRVAFVRMICH